MTDLPQIAQAVAKALGLETTVLFPSIHGMWGPKFVDGEQVLEPDGSNLFSPYWQCRARDWLLEHGYGLVMFKDGFAINHTSPLMSMNIPGPASEFAARAIYALLTRSTT